MIIYKTDDNGNYLEKYKDDDDDGKIKIKVTKSKKKMFIDINPFIEMINHNTWENRAKLFINKFKEICTDSKGNDPIQTNIANIR